MSLLVPGEAAWQHVLAGAAALDCFLCGERISPQSIAVYWGGATASIAFHRGCASSFVLRLARDCWELEQHEEIPR